MLMTVVGALVIGVVVAPAGPSSSVVVAPVEVTGDVPQTIAGELTLASTRGVVDAGASAVDMPPGCADNACASEAAGTRGYVLSTTVDAQDSDYSISTRLVDASGEVIDERSESCEICNYDEVAETLAALVSAAVGPVATPAAPPPPPPPVASTLASVESGPQPADKPEGKTKLMRGLGFAGVGVGVGSLGAGIALLVLNERPGGNCEGDNVDAGGDCEFRYNTLGGGAGLTIGGALAIGAGVGLLLLSRGHKPDTRSAKVNVSASAGGLRLRF